jgi:hypothetical protein
MAKARPPQGKEWANKWGVNAIFIAAAHHLATPEKVLTRPDRFGAVTPIRVTVRQKGRRAPLDRLAWRALPQIGGSCAGRMTAASALPAAANPILPAHAAISAQCLTVQRAGDEPKGRPHGPSRRMRRKLLTIRAGRIFVDGPTSLG